MGEEVENKLTIRLHIYDTDISVGILRKDEAAFRKGAELINQLLNHYYSLYKGSRSDKEIIYFAMIDLALQMETQLQRNDVKPYDDILTQLTAEIEDALNTKPN